MLGKTHIATGIASSLLVLQPSNTSELLATVTGGLIGGWICDIDCRDSNIDEGAIEGFILTVVFGGALLLLDNKLGAGMCDFFLTNFGIKSLIGLIIFAMCCIYGFSSSHRTFMHSIIGFALMTFSTSLFCFPITYAFAIGFISHILLDVLNKRGLQLFFPLKAKVCTNTCYSDGKENDFIFVITLMLSLGLGAFYFLNSITKMEMTFNNDILTFGLNRLQWYLIIVNVVTFLVYCIDYLICTHMNIDGESQNFIHTILNILGIAGGAFGMLAALILLNDFVGRENANWFIIATSLTVVWLIIICIIFNPLNLQIRTLDDINYWTYLPLIIYLIVINIISFILFCIDKFRPKWRKSEIGLILLGVIGGSVGGIISMAITRKKTSIPHFSTGFYILFAVQAFALGYVIMYGII